MLLVPLTDTGLEGWREKRDMSILSRVRAAGIGVPGGENNCESAIG